MTLLACFLFGSILAYCLVTLIYRLHIHPLSRFPGPRLAAVTGLYEIYFSAWGASSFDDEIARMHKDYGPVVRITPDEVHVQEQLYDTSSADCWVKGTKALDSGYRQSGGGFESFQIWKRSISGVRSILQVEVHQIIRGFVRKHQVDKVFSSRIRPFLPASSLPVIRVDLSEESDLEDGHQSARSFPNPRPKEVFGEAWEGYPAPRNPKLNAQGP